MRDDFTTKLRLVRTRCHINLFLEHFAQVLMMTGGVFAVAVLVERLLALNVTNRWTPWVILGAGVLGIAWLCILKRLNPMQAALLIDERLRLQERFSTSLALQDSRDPFVSAARTEAKEKAPGLEVGSYFPIRPSRRWLYGLGIWLIVGVMYWYLPQKDLLSLVHKRQEEKQRDQEWQQVKADINQSTQAVQLAVNQLGDSSLSEELSQLAKVPEGEKPEIIKRQAIRKLGELSDKIKAIQKDIRLESFQQTQQKLKQLRSTPNAFSPKLDKALARGDFTEAAKLLREIQKQIAQSKLSDQERKDLTQQIQNLAKQLQKQAQQNQELEKELQKQGLDKRLAKSSEKQLRQALEKQGLRQEKIEQILKKASACRMSSNQCSKLSEAMAACGGGSNGLSASELEEVMGQLSELESLKDQLKMAQASLKEIEGAIACLGEGMCEGIGMQGEFKEGESKNIGAGTGGPGRGYGPRGIDKTGNTDTEKTKVQNKSRPGPVIASWYFKGEQIKGEAKRDYTELVQAASSEAAEAISENDIPHKYESSVKKYFDQLEEKPESPEAAKEPPKKTNTFKTF